MSKTKISDYQEAIRIIQEMHSGIITEGMIGDMILKIAEFQPDLLVRARDAIRETPRSLERTVNDFLRQGDRIRAIKAFRDGTGVGLREAKDAIDGYQRRMDIERRASEDE